MFPRQTAASGTLVPARDRLVKCNKDCDRWMPLWTFRPSDRKDQLEFDRALEEDDYETADKLRAMQCIAHREYGLVSSITQGNSNKARCWRMKDEIYRDMVRRGCVHCGAHDMPMEADHIDERTKTKDVSNYQWWAAHGGPDAMRAEYDDKCQPLCMPCNRKKEAIRRNSTVNAILDELKRIEYDYMPVKKRPKGPLSRK